ncbi:hypothetical protein ACFW2E_35015, partial [Streptomyces sp. NPDC058964]
APPQLYPPHAAGGSAHAAWTAARQARDSATAAGKDATAAHQAANEAFHTAVVKRQQAQAELRKWYEQQKQQSQHDDDGSWVPGWLKDTVNTIGDYGQAILGNSDIWKGLFETGLGVIAVGDGATIDIAGGGLCLTIIGCLEGAPAIVVGTGVAGAGIYGITDGISRFNNGLGQALREAEGTPASGGPQIDSNGWPVATQSNCLECAEVIKGKVGGEIYEMKDSLGAKLGPSERDPYGQWHNHFLVIKDGRAYDAFTGSEGMDLNTYRRQWKYWEYIRLDGRPDLG